MKPERAIVLAVIVIIAFLIHGLLFGCVRPFSETSGRDAGTVLTVDHVATFHNEPPKTIVSTTKGVYLLIGKVSADIGAPARLERLYNADIGRYDYLLCIKYSQCYLAGGM